MAAKISISLIVLSVLYYSNPVFSQPDPDTLAVTQSNQVIDQINELRAITEQNLGRFLSHYFVYESTKGNSSFLHPDNSNNEAFKFTRINGKGTYIVKPELVDQFIKAALLLTNPQLNDSISTKLESLPKIDNFEATHQFLKDFFNPQNFEFRYHDAYHEHRDSVKSQFLYQILANKNGPNIREFKFYLVSLHNPDQRSLGEQTAAFKRKFGWGSLYGDLSDTNLINLYNEKPQMRALILNLVDSFFPFFDLNLGSIDSINSFFPKKEKTITGFQMEGAYKVKAVQKDITFYRSIDFIKYFMNSVIYSSVIINSYGDNKQQEVLNQLLPDLQDKPRYLQDMISGNERLTYINEQLEGMGTLMRILEMTRSSIIDIGKKNIVTNDRLTRVTQWKELVNQLKLNFKIKAMKDRYKLLFSDNAKLGSVFDILLVLSGDKSPKQYDQESVKRSLVKILNKDLDESSKLNKIVDLLKKSFPNDSKTDFQILAELLLQEKSSIVAESSKSQGQFLNIESATATNKCSALFKRN